MDKYNPFEYRCNDLAMSWSQMQSCPSDILFSSAICSIACEW